MQEFHATESCIKKAFPNAVVLEKSHGQMRIVVECKGIKVVELAQRDMFRKYGHPGKSTILEHLEAFKEEFAA